MHGRDADDQSTGATKRRGYRRVFGLTLGHEADALNSLQSHCRLIAEVPLAAAGTGGSGAGAYRWVGGMSAAVTTLPIDRELGRHSATAPWLPMRRASVHDGGAPHPTRATHPGFRAAPRRGARRGARQ